jgi:hypothetical protein
MKKVLIIILIGLVWIGHSVLIFGAEKTPQKIIDLAKNELVNLGVDSIIVEAVKTENAKEKTLAAIKVIDDKWKKTPGISEFMKTLMESECGKYLQEIQDSVKYYAEIFVMDNKGANVAMSEKTSDYWQGDEDKFIESYKKGEGAVHISDVEFDESTQAYLVQVSVPVLVPIKDKKKAIGAITFGIDVDKLEE